MQGIRTTIVSTRGLFAFCSAALFCAGSVGAADVATVLENAHLLGPSESIVLRAVMDIHSRGGASTRTVEVSIEREADGAARILAQVIEPAFLRNLKFLMHRDHRGRSDFWMRTSSGTRRLTGRDNTESIFNSDFTVEDFSYIDIAAYELALLPDQPAGSTVIDGRLTQASPTHTRRVFTVEDETGLIERVRYLDANGRMVKEYELLTRQEISGQTLPHEAVMTNHTEGTFTKLTIVSVDPDARIPARVFNPAGL